jgi:hypothetical protein
MMGMGQPPAAAPQAGLVMGMPPPQQQPAKMAGKMPGKGMGMPAGPGAMLPPTAMGMGFPMAAAGPTNVGSGMPMPGGMMAMPMPGMGMQLTGVVDPKQVKRTAALDCGPTRAGPRKAAQSPKPDRPLTDEEEAHRLHELKKREYKPYSLEDFKRVNQPVRGGGLGPNDSDETRKAREMKSKAKEYATGNNRVNMVVLSAEGDLPKKPIGRQLSDNASAAKVRMERAREFSKLVPKPKQKAQDQIVSLDDGMDSPRSARGGGGGAAYGAGGGDEVEVPEASNELLLELEERHKRDQDMIASVKRQLKLK